MHAAGSEQVHRLNYLAGELNAAYHQVALKFGMPDSTLNVLYALVDGGGSCTLADIYHSYDISKQTVNSAIRRLEKDGIIVLSPYRGKTKLVSLTEAGQRYVANTVSRLYEAERSILETWTEEEIHMHIALTEKYLADFKARLETL